MDRFHSRAISAPVTVIGIDCATAAQRIGLARGTWERGDLLLEAATTGAAQDPVDVVASWVEAAPHRALLCLDAPLGWPRPLGSSLVEHRAGAPLRPPSDALFHRYTDACCYRRLGQFPMEVGADRIARTARAALALLQEVRRRTGWPIPLAWNPDHLLRAQAIETYPAATLKARGLPNRGYKRGAQGRPARQRLLQALADEWRLALDPEDLLANADAFDAALCVLTGGDFLAGRCCPPPPDAIETVRQEGWIWTLDTAPAEDTDEEKDDGR